MSPFPRLHSHCQAVFQAHMTFSRIYVVIFSLSLGSTKAESENKACAQVYLGSSSWGVGMKKQRRRENQHSLLYQAGHHHKPLLLSRVELFHLLCERRKLSIDFSASIPVFKRGAMDTGWSHAHQVPSNSRLHLAWMPSSDFDIPEPQESLVQKVRGK